MFYVVRHVEQKGAPDMPKKAKELSALAVAKFKKEGRYAVGGVDGLHFRIAGTITRAGLQFFKTLTRKRFPGIGPTSPFRRRTGT
jgi:hypothetical protein